MEYIKSLAGVDSDGCFLCDYWADQASDRKNLVVWRGKHCLTVLNKFPYTNGHLLIACGAHKGSMEQLSEAELVEMATMTRDGIRVLKSAVGAQGFNVGMNFGRCAGAGLPDHLHTHVVPRWSGDTNYMAVVGDVRVIPQSLEDLHASLSAAAAELGLPTVG